MSQEESWESSWSFWIALQQSQTWIWRYIDGGCYHIRSVMPVNLWDRAWYHGWAYSQDHANGLVLYLAGVFDAPKISRKDLKSAHKNRFGNPSGCTHLEIIYCTITWCTRNVLSAHKVVSLSMVVISDGITPTSSALLNCLKDHHIEIWKMSAWNNCYKQVS